MKLFTVIVRPEVKAIKHPKVKINFRFRFSDLSWSSVSVESSTEAKSNLFSFIFEMHLVAGITRIGRHKHVINSVNDFIVIFMFKTIVDLDQL